MWRGSQPLVCQKNYKKIIHVIDFWQKNHLILKNWRHSWYFWLQYFTAVTRASYQPLLMTSNAYVLNRTASHRSKIFCLRRTWLKVELPTEKHKISKNVGIFAFFSWCITFPVLTLQSPKKILPKNYFFQDFLGRYKVFKKNVSVEN